jgi:hypothetical protein
VIRSSMKFALVASVLALASSTNAAPTPWDVPAGSQATFDYSAGQTANGKLGSGISTGSGFFFTPASFAASGTPSGSDNDTISVILTAKPNQMFTSISSSILGDFSIFGPGSVNANGSLKVTNLDTSSVLTSPLAFSNLPASTATSADGGWDGAAALALPAGWSNIKIEMDSTLLAEGSSNGIAFIQAKDGEIGVTTAEVPLPAAALVAPVLGFIGWRAKKKFAK